MHEDNPDISEEVIPLTVADMEFEIAEPIKKGLQDYLETIVLGYGTPYPEFVDAVVDWQKRKHDYEVKPEWLVQTPGVVTGFAAAMRAFTEPKDGIIIFRPIYHPMMSVIDQSDLEQINVPLVNEEEIYTIDFDKFEQVAKDPKNKVLLLCSPHNPVGRVWTKDELEEIGRIALENDLIIISDEIWQDLALTRDHTVLASISDEIEDITITCTAPSKTFNVAGLNTSNLIIKNADLRQKVEEKILNMGAASINILGYKACEIAYTECDEWLDGLLEVLKDNKKVAEEFCDKWGFEYSDMEGTYVFWANFESLGMDKDQLERFLKFDAQFFANQGYIFGKEGDLYQRLNLALPTKALKEQLDRLDSALCGLKSND